MPVARKKTNKTPIENTEKAIRLALQGENLDELISGFSPTELEMLGSMIAEVKATGSSAELENLWRLDYTRKPPTISQFVDDPFWLGGTLLPSEENPGLFPTWKEILVNDFDLESRIHNVVITGSLGIGKTFVATAMMLYRAVLASLMRNPHGYLSLSVGSRIVYVIMSVTRAQVAETAYGAAISYMANSPYFRDELHFDPERKYAGQVIDLGNQIQIIGGSKSQHIIGRNTLGVLLDEGNWRLEANPDLKAYKLYDEIRSRIKNRFQKTAGFLPALSLIASSAKEESSFTEKVMHDIRNVNNTKLETIYSNAVYKIKNPSEWRRLGASESLIDRHALKLGKRWFKVSYGLKSIPPKVMSGWYDEKGKPVGSQKHEAPSTGCRVELVPEDYRADYERNVTANLQSMSGISTGGSFRLFSSSFDIEECIRLGEKAGVVNPATTLLMPISEEDDRLIWDYLDHATFLQRVKGHIKPKRHPESLRFAHMDLATRNQCGIGICHRVGYQTVDGLVDAATARVYEESRLIVEYDFILTITAGKTKPISFEKIQQFFLWLRDRCAFQFGMITADTWQSIAQLQMLENRGFNTGSLSLDRNKRPYMAWRSGFEEHRILTYLQAMMVLEAENLIDGPKMVDHPTEGECTSKDTSDGACGAYWNAINATDQGLHGSATMDGNGSINADDTHNLININVTPERRNTRVYSA